MARIAVIGGHGKVALHLNRLLTEFLELARAVGAGRQVLVHLAHLLLVHRSENVGTEQLRVVLRGHPATPFSATC